jgi:hypothetical protein
VRQFPCLGLAREVFGGRGLCPSVGHGEVFAHGEARGARRRDRVQSALPRARDLAGARPRNVGCVVEVVDGLKHCSPITVRARQRRGGCRTFS